MRRQAKREVILCLALLAGRLVWAAEAPALAELLEQALQHNPELQAMRHRATAAEAVYRQSRASSYPQMGLRSSYTHTDNPPQVFMQQLNQATLDMQDPGFTPNQPDPRGNLRASLALQYRLWDASRRGQQAASDAQQQVSAQQTAAARNELVHRVTRGYYQLLQAQVLAQVQESALRSLGESLRVARERFASGATVKTDVLNLEVQVAQARENLIRAQNEIRLAIAALHATIGEAVIPPGGLPIPALPPAAPPSPPAPDQIEVRPEARASARLVAAAQARVRAARGQRLPAFDLFASSDWDSEKGDEVEQSYTAGIALQWPWYTGGATKGAISEAQALLAAARAGHARVLLALQLDLAQAVIQLQEAWTRLPVAEQAIGSAEEALRITRAQYQEGAADLTALLVAETGLTETRMRHTAATYTYQIARSNLARAAGELTHTHQPAHRPQSASKE